MKEGAWARQRPASARLPGRATTPTIRVIPFHMALFARRKVQEAIDRCGLFMPPEAIACQVAALNACNHNSLPKEWEIMVSAAASTLCTMEYEPDLGGKRRGDLLLRPHGPGTPGCLVEITTISDNAAHERNPYDEVCYAIRRKLRKLGCPKGPCSIRVEGDTEGPYGDARMVLHLGSGRAEELFDARFYDFVRALKAAPTVPRTHHWKGPKLDIKLTFAPGERYSPSGHLSYTTPYSRRKNTLYSALESKRRQLADTGHLGPLGVIVCDGGCRLLSNTLHSSGGAASLHDIMHAHFSDSNRLAFALVIHAELPSPSFLNGMRRERLLKIKPFLRVGSSDLARDTLELLKALPLVLPRPLLTGQNAARCYRDKWEADGRHGIERYITMSDNKVRLSARVVLEILAGARTPEEFFAGFNGKGPFPGNHFSTQKDNGRLINSIEFVKGEDDDDQIEFKFGPPDPAIAKFRVPPSL